MSDQPPVGRLSTRSVILIVGLIVFIAVGATAGTATLRGSRDTAPELFGGIGTPRDAAGAPGASGSDAAPARSCPPATTEEKPRGEGAPSPQRSPLRCLPTTPYVQNLSVGTVLPAGWSVERRTDDELTLAGPHAIVSLSQRHAAPDLIAGGLADDGLADAQRRYPDAKLCRPPVQVLLDNGPPGLEYALCYTVLPEAGGAAAADEVVAQAVFPGGGGSAQLLTERVVYADSDGEAALDELEPILKSLYWKRLGTEPLSIL